MIEGYSIYDEKAKLFSPPFFVKNVMLAVRSVNGAATEPTSQLAKFPNDYSLYRICNFNEESGDVENASPAHIVSIQQIIEKGTRFENHQS